MQLNDQKTERFLASGLSYNSGVVPCTNSNVWGTLASYQSWCVGCASGQSRNVIYKVSYSMSCVEFKYTASAFNFNYNPSRRAAERSNIRLANGVSCSDCWGYVGTTFHTIFSYSGRYYRFLAELYGTAGLTQN